MDFAENYACIAQQEIQSAHWGHQQVTIHPTMSYYRCQDEGCEETVIETLIFITSDLQHDAHAVNKFAQITHEHLTQNRGLAITKSIHMTDGCVAQYKSKTPFTDISYSFEDYGYPTERHFYGSRHGKGPSDGAGAVIKSSARRAVNGQNVIINDAKDLHDFACQKLTKNEKHSKRTIFHVVDINRDRPDRSQTKTVMGTRKLQCVKSIEKNRIATRNLSCFCDECIKDGGGNCLNEDYVDPWIIQNLQQAGEGQLRGVTRNRRSGNGRMRVGGRGGQQEGRGGLRGEGRDGPRLRG